MKSEVLRKLARTKTRRVSVCLEKKTNLFRNSGRTKKGFTIQILILEVKQEERREAER